MQRVIASVFLALFAIMVGRFILFSGSESLAFEQATLIDKTIVVGGVIGAFGFWFVMLADFFANRYLKRRILWGFCLIIFSWLSALIYFFLHFLPHHTRIEGVRESMGSDSFDAKK